MGITRKLLEKAENGEGKANCVLIHDSSEVIEVIQETVKMSTRESVTQVKFYNPYSGKSGIIADYRKEI